MTEETKKKITDIVIRVILALLLGTGFFYFRSSSTKQMGNNKSIQGDGNLMIENADVNIKDLSMNINITLKEPIGNTDAIDATGLLSNISEKLKGLSKQWVGEQQLNKTEREFFETMEYVFNCHLDNGIICAPNFLPVFNQKEGILENVRMKLEVRDTIYDLYFDYLTSQKIIVGWCLPDYSSCYIAEPYKLENNLNKPVKNCINVHDTSDYSSLE